MPRSKKAAKEAHQDVFDEQAALRQQEAPAPQEPQNNGKSHAAAVEKKKYIPPEDPFGFESIKSGENRVRLLKSEGEGAWVIRFAKNPNEAEGHSKENPHPVLKMLKSEGFRWGFDGGDGKGGWGKTWANDPYGTDHIEARRVLQQAAEMIGQTKEHGISA